MHTLGIVLLFAVAVVACGIARDQGIASPTAKTIVPVAALQLLMWCFTSTGADGGVAWGVYSWLLLGYWAGVWLIWAVRLARGRLLGRVIAATGWLPPVGCGFWLLWLAGLLGG